MRISDWSADVCSSDLVVAKGPATLVTEASVEQVSNALSWRHGMLTFDKVTLAEAAAEFNRYNATKLVLGDETAAGIRIGGTFEAENADAFARLLGSAYGLQVVHRSEEHTSELQSLIRISYAVFCLKKTYK